MPPHKYTWHLTVGVAVALHLIDGAGDPASDAGSTSAKYLTLELPSDVDAALRDGRAACLLAGVADRNNDTADAMQLGGSEAKRRRDRWRRALATTEQWHGVRCADETRMLALAGDADAIASLLGAIVNAVAASTSTHGGPVAPAVRLRPSGRDGPTPHQAMTATATTSYAPPLTRAEQQQMYGHHPQQQPPVSASVAGPPIDALVLPLTHHIARQAMDAQRELATMWQAQRDAEEAYHAQQRAAAEGERVRRAQEERRRLEAAERESCGKQEWTLRGCLVDGEHEAREAVRLEAAADHLSASRAAERRAGEERALQKVRDLEEKIRRRKADLEAQLEAEAAERSRRADELRRLGRPDPSIDVRPIAPQRNLTVPTFWHYVGARTVILSSATCGHNRRAGGPLQRQLRGDVPTPPTKTSAAAQEQPSAAEACLVSPIHPAADGFNAEDEAWSDDALAHASSRSSQQQMVSRATTANERAHAASPRESPKPATPSSQHGASAGVCEGDGVDRSQCASPAASSIFAVPSSAGTVSNSGGGGGPREDALRLIFTATRAQEFPSVSMRTLLKLLKELLRKRAHDHDAELARTPPPPPEASAQERQRVERLADMRLAAEQRAGRFLTAAIRFGWVRRHKLVQAAQSDTAVEGALGCARCAPIVNVLMDRTASFAPDTLPHGIALRYSAILCDSCRNELKLPPPAAADDDNASFAADTTTHAAARLVQAVLRARRSERVAARKIASSLSHVLRRRRRMQLVVRIQFMVRRWRNRAAARLASSELSSTSAAHHQVAATFETQPAKAFRMCARDGPILRHMVLQIERHGDVALSRYQAVGCVGCREVVVEQVYRRAVRRVRAADTIAGWHRTLDQRRCRRQMGVGTACRCEPVQDWLEGLRRPTVRQMHLTAEWVCRRARCVGRFATSVARIRRLDHTATFLQNWARWRILRSVQLTDPVAVLHGKPRRSVVHARATGVCRACFPMIENVFRRFAAFAAFAAKVAAEPLSSSNPFHHPLREDVLERFALHLCDTCVGALGAVCRPFLSMRRIIRRFMEGVKLRKLPPPPLVLPRTVCQRASCRAAYVWHRSSAPAAPVLLQRRWLCAACTIGWAEYEERANIEAERLNFFCRVASRARGLVEDRGTPGFAVTTVALRWRRRQHVYGAWLHVCPAVSPADGDGDGAIGMASYAASLASTESARLSLRDRTRQLRLRVGGAERFADRRAARFFTDRWRWLRHRSVAAQQTTQRHVDHRACRRCGPVLAELRKRVNFLEYLGQQPVEALDPTWATLRQADANGDANEWGIRELVATCEEVRQLRALQLRDRRKGLSKRLNHYIRVCCSRCRFAAAKMIKAHDTTAL